MTEDAKKLRFDRMALVQELEAAGARFTKGNVCSCPWHEDKHPSAGIYQAEDGHWAFKCQTATCGIAGDVFDIRARREGLALKDILPRDGKPGNGSTPAAEAKPDPAPKQSKPVGKTLEEATAAAARIAGGQIEAVYHYENPDTGKARFHVCRIRHADGSKSFRPLIEAADGYRLTAPPKPWPLYRRREIRDSAFAVIVEGEKACDALTGIGIPATTGAGGAGKASLSDWAPLAGKDAYIWPDADPPDAKGRRTGIEHGRDVAKILEGLDPAPRVFWIDPDALALPPKGDAWDFVNRIEGDAEAKRRAVMELIERAAPMATGPAAEVSGLIEDAIAGRRVAVAWPWAMLSHFTRALLPGTVTLICGDAGARKSFAVLQAFMKWRQDGLRVALYELEEDRAFHLLRALAILDGNADLTDPDFARSNPDAARAAHERHRDFLDSFGRCVFAAPQKQVTLAELAAWVKARCDEGARLIGIDPVTAAAIERDSWAADSRFLIEAKRIIGDAGASLILVTHPRKRGAAKGPAGLDDLSGGAAYSRFSQTVIWLERLPHAELATVSFGQGTEEAQVNERVLVMKARNATGAGARLGMFFDPETLRTSEAGMLLK